MSTSGATRSPRDVARSVIEIESLAVRGLLDQLDESFDRAVETIVAIRGRVVCTGMGKSGLILKKVAATLASTGTPSLFLHPAEAIHGDVGMITKDDVVLAASYSGTTEELIRLVEIVRRLGVPLLVMTGNSESPLARHADIHLRTEVDQEACPLNLAPTASTSVTLALGDALAMALLEARGFTTEDFARLHPGGRLGKRLLEVKELMHQGDALPKVRRDADLRAAIVEISGKGLGITAVEDENGRLVGCLSDGDLRRLLARDEQTSGDHHRLLDLPVEQTMTQGPRTLPATALAPVALQQMEENRITTLFVVDEEHRLLGAVHIHDLWRLELF